MTLEIIRNDGRFGVGRMDWLLICDGELVSHCGLRFPLETSIAAVYAWAAVLGIAAEEDTDAPAPEVPF